ncbi:MAG: class I SAM-dependent methyltransferase [Sandaracinaceae bacterium]|nr:class I SAM-dependent methyltransferase [Sandaracinaceae bacterium]
MTVQGEKLREQKRELPFDFDRIASSYDLLAALSPGYHRHLLQSASHLPCAPGVRIADLCCGTGASTLAILKHCPQAVVVGLDASEKMLSIARSKPQLNSVSFVLGDATFPQSAGLEGPFDALFGAYALRNLPDPDLALSNWKSMLRRGGRLVLHEFCLSGSALSRLAWDAIALGLILPAGVILSGRAGVYRYLHESVRTFDTVDALEARLARAGFVQVRSFPIRGWLRGILHTFVAECP